MKKNISGSEAPQKGRGYPQKKKKKKMYVYCYILIDVIYCMWTTKRRAKMNHFLLVIEADFSFVSCSYLYVWTLLIGKKICVL